MHSQNHPPEQPRLCWEVGRLVPQIPGRELPGEVATRRFCSVCKPLGAALLEITEGVGPAETPPSEALGLDTKIGAHYPEVRRQ